MRTKHSYSLLLIQTLIILLIPLIKNILVLLLLIITTIVYPLSIIIVREILYRFENRQIFELRIGKSKVLFDGVLPNEKLIRILSSILRDKYNFIRIRIRIVPCEDNISYKVGEITICDKLFDKVSEKEIERKILYYYTYYITFGEQRVFLLPLISRLIVLPFNSNYVITLILVFVLTKIINIIYWILLNTLVCHFSQDCKINKYNLDISLRNIILYGGSLNE